MRFAYRGVPVEKGGAVVAVSPVRGIAAENGKVYRGVVGVDSRGVRFVYNQVPGGWSQSEQLLTAGGEVFLTVDDEEFYLKD